MLTCPKPSRSRQRISMRFRCSSMRRIMTGRLAGVSAPLILTVDPVARARRPGSAAAGVPARAAAAAARRRGGRRRRDRERPRPSRHADAAGLPALRTVVTASVGLRPPRRGRASPRAACRRSACPHYCSDEVADHALASVLALWRGLPRLDRDRRAGIWDLASDAGLRRIAGSTLGIVGFGRIGRQLARRALAPGDARCSAYDPLRRRRGDPGRPAPHRRLSTTCMRASHAVSLHMALAPATDGLIGARELALMQPWAVLVNVSRAEPRRPLGARGRTARRHARPRPRSTSGSTSRRCPAIPAWTHRTCCSRRTSRTRRSRPRLRCCRASRTRCAPGSRDGDGGGAAAYGC